MRDRTFFGEPRALAYLTFTEAWERFSFYGVTALLVLYMSQQLFSRAMWSMSRASPHFVPGSSRCSAG